MIIITADVGGSKTSIAVTRDGERLVETRGQGTSVRPGRAVVAATMIADLCRRALAQANLLRADILVVGAAGAGREADAEEIRITLSRERFDAQVVVGSDVMLAFAARPMVEWGVRGASGGRWATRAPATGSVVRPSAPWDLVSMVVAPAPSSSPVS